MKNLRYVLWAALTAVLVSVLLAYGSPRRSMPVNVLVTPAPTAEATPNPTVTPEPTPSPSPAVPAEYVLRSKKDSRTYLEDVVLIQKRLKELGYLATEADGYYGDGTFSAIVAFQRNNGLEVDGMAGTGTQELLFESDSVIDATGNIYVPFVVAQAEQPEAQATATPRSYSLVSFEGGAALNDLLKGGTWYDDGALEARLTQEDGFTAVLITVNDPSLFRSAMSGSLTRPDEQRVSVVAAFHNAAVAFAGTDSGCYEVRQGYVVSGNLSSSRPLLLVDSDGSLHLYPAYAAENGLKAHEGSIYQALTAREALIISGVAQPGLSETPEESLLAFGQTGDGTYCLVYGENKSCAELSQRMRDAGCENAAVLGSGGIYTGFGSLTQDEPDVLTETVLYFAGMPETKGE